jgi:NAD(P)-dependent dehydrogenase (short-subunit alcohol dehydrogenase family)
VVDYRKLFDLNGKTAVVLGAASGIGKSSAEALATWARKSYAPIAIVSASRRPSLAFARQAVTPRR